MLSVLPALLLLLNAVVNVDAAVNVSGGTWRISHNVFSEREKPAYACLDSGTVLSFGGVATSGSSTAGGNKNDLWFLDTTVDEWHRAFPFGAIPPISAATMAAVGGTAYLFGGQLNDRRGTASGALYALPTTALSATSGTSLEWQQVQFSAPAATPGARYRHASVTVANGFVILFGLSERQQFSDVWRFTASNGSWSLLSAGTGPTDPAPRYNPCCKLVTGTQTIVCFGGTGTAGDTAETIAFDLGTRQWRLLGPADGSPGLPSPRRLTQCEVINGSLVAFSGYSSTQGVLVENALNVFDLASATWSTVPLNNANTTPAPRSGGAMITCGGRTYLYCGTDEVSEFNDLWRLESNLTYFTLLQPSFAIPPAREQHLGVLYGERFYVMFGEDANGVALTDVWSVDLETELWRRESTYFPFPTRTGATAVLFGSFIWVIGGMLAGDTFANGLVVFDTLGQSWTVPPRGAVLATPACVPRRRRRGIDHHCLWWFYANSHRDQLRGHVQRGRAEVV
jgi:hypothetical protein